MNRFLTVALAGLIGVACGPTQPTADPVPFVSTFPYSPPKREFVTALPPILLDGEPDYEYPEDGECPASYPVKAFKKFGVTYELWYVVPEDDDYAYYRPDACFRTAENAYNHGYDPKHGRSS